MAKENLSILPDEVLLVIMGLENRFAEYGLSPAGAYGAMQLMPIAVQGVRQDPLCNPTAGWRTLPGQIQYGGCFLAKWYLIYQDLGLAVIHYNGGGRTVEKFLRGERINNETANYVSRFGYILRQCRGELRGEFNTEGTKR